MTKKVQDSGDHAHENRLDPVSLAIYTFFNVVHTKTKRWHVFSLFQCKKREEKCLHFWPFTDELRGIVDAIVPMN